MAKRKRQQDIKMRIAEGRGSGIGKEYIPLIKIQDVYSLGRLSRIRGIKHEGSMNYYQIWKEIIFSF